MDPGTDSPVSIRKLAEIWEVDDDYQLRVAVGAFQRGLTANVGTAEEIASFEVIEVLRKIVEESDAQRLQYRADTELRPSD